MQASYESIKLDRIEQYGRRQNLEFKGIPVQENEVVVVVVVVIYCRALIKQYKHEI